MATTQNLFSLDLVNFPGILCKALPKSSHRPLSDLPPCPLGIGRGPKVVGTHSSDTAE